MRVVPKEQRTTFLFQNRDVTPQTMDKYRDKIIDVNDTTERTIISPFRLQNMNMVLVLNGQFFFAMNFFPQDVSKNRRILDRAVRL